MASDTPPNVSVYDVLGWFDKNRKKVITLAAAAVAIVAVIIGVVNHQKRKEPRASAALSEVRVPSSPAMPALAGTAEALLKVAQDHAGTRAAASALVQAAGIYYSENNYQAAHVQFSRLVQEYPDGDWIGQASLGVASTLSAMGKTNDAIAAFENVRKRFANHEVADEAKIAVARLYESTKPEEAFKLYEELIKPGGQPSMNQMSRIAEEASMLQGILVKRLPELEKLITPPLPPPSPFPPISMAPPVANTNIQITMTTNRAVMPTIVTNRSGSNIPIQIRTVPNSTAPTPGTPNTAPSISSAPAAKPVVKPVTVPPPTAPPQ